MIRLSLCIATLNRAGFIGQTLAGVLAQLTDEVEIVVVDGASTDGTDAVVAAIFEGRANCHYHRLAKKGGVDQDYAKSVALARGEFCWLMTDDDILSPGAIHTVIEHLRKEPDLLVVNAEVADPELKSILVSKKLRIDADRDFDPSEQGELLALAGDLLSFIGSVVIRRSLWECRAKEPYYGTEFIHVGVIFQKPLERFARVLAKPMIRIRYGNAQWTGRAFEIWMFKWPGLIWSFPFTDEAKSAVCAKEPWRSVSALVMMKARGCFTWQDYKTRLAPRTLGWWTRFKAAAIARFPEVFFNALLSWTAAIFVPHAKGLRLELRQSRFDYRQRWWGNRNV